MRNLRQLLALAIRLQNFVSPANRVPGVPHGGEYPVGALHVAVLAVPGHKQQQVTGNTWSLATGHVLGHEVLVGVSVCGHACALEAALDVLWAEGVAVLDVDAEQGVVVRGRHVKAVLLL